MTPGGPPRLRALRFFRLAQRLLPRDFRRAHGEQMALVYGQLLREAWADRGWRGLIGCRGREYRALLQLAWRARRPAARRLSVGSGALRSPFFDAGAHDARAVCRSLARSPGYAAVTLFTLALGIGASALLFSVVDGVLLRPLDFPEPDRLVAVWDTSTSPDADAPAGRRWRVPPGTYADWATQNDVFANMGMYGAAIFTLTDEGEPEQILGAAVDVGYFPTLGVRPLLGRLFSAEDSRAPATQDSSAGGRIILSSELWRRRFGSRPDVVGRTIHLDGRPYEVVGVLPPGLYPTWPATVGTIDLSPARQQFWVPMRLSGGFEWNRTAHVFGVIARLKPGVGLSGAQATLDTITARLASQFPKEYGGRGVIVVPLADEAHGSARPALVLLLGAVGVLLLIACANLATLGLARSTVRSTEFAVRAALGAGRGRLVRGLLTESVILAAAGGLLGLLLARASLAGLLALLPTDVPRLDTVHIDARVVLFGVFISALTAVLIGSLPALQASHPDLQDALREGGRGTTASRRRARMHGVLVVAEVALACTLVAGAGLLARSFARLISVAPGFSSDRVLVLSLSLPSTARYASPEARARFHAGLLDRLRSLPDVQSVALAYDHPLSATWSDAFRIEGRQTTDDASAWQRIVSADYVRTMRIALVRGRGFSATDDASHSRVVLVNQAFVRRFFPIEEPLGRHMLIPAPTRPDPPRSYEIVGIVGDEKFLGLAAPAEPAFYVPMAQFPQHGFDVLARTAGDPRALTVAARQAVWSLDPNLPIGTIDTMDGLLRRSVAQARFTLLVVGTFGSLAFLLATVGLYSLVAYTVTQRVREIAVRIALGARSRDVMRPLIRQSLGLTLLGLAVGLSGAIAAAPLISRLLFGISPLDPSTFIESALTMLAVAALASYLPARRAARVDPLRALTEG